MTSYERQDKAKYYEAFEAKRKLLNKIPVVARMDGVNFSKFTKNLDKPYDVNLAALMIDTTFWLAQEFNANCAYTESDEISLGWYYPEDKTELYGGWRIQKLVSHLAAKTTWRFNQLMRNFLPDKKEMACFDARLWNVPTLEEAVNAFWSRELDATRNSIESAARCHFSHKECFEKNGSELQEMLFSKGINWNNYPNFFKRGTFFVKKQVFMKFSSQELENLPEKHEARRNPDLIVERNIWKQYNDLEKFSSISNKEKFLFFGEDPEYGSF